jgi:hypothetical protein
LSRNFLKSAVVMHAVWVRIIEGFMPTDVKKESAPTGEAVLQPLPETELAVMRVLSEEEIREALSKGAAEQAATEALAYGPSAYPTVRVR